MANFDLYFETLIKHEGGFVNHPKDPGGATNLGITDKLDGKTDGLVDVNGDSKGDVKIKELRKDQAKLIYKRLFWDALKADEIKSQSVAEILFDFAVNSGVGTAARAIQKIVNVAQDGNIGPKTLLEINKKEASQLFEEIKTFRKQFYARIIVANPKLKTFEKGWNNRINSFKFTT